MTAPGRLIIDVSDRVATLHLSNPLRRNAIGADMWRALAAFAQQAQHDGQLRAVVVRGDGDQAFSAGADIAEFDTHRGGTSHAKAYDDLVESTCRLLEQIPQPTIAVVRGACVGAGISVASSCDMIVAADDSFFAVPAARLGLGYDPRGIERFLRVFGLAATRALIYTAAPLPAARAHALGAVHMLASASSLQASAEELVRRVCGNAPLTLRAAKTAMRALTVAREASLLKDAYALAEAADSSADYREGRMAFAQKRTPCFDGE